MSYLRFLKISEIDLKNYKDSVFITFDMEWAEDEVIDFILNILNKIPF